MLAGGHRGYTSEDGILSVAFVNPDPLLSASLGLFLWQIDTLPMVDLATILPKGVVFPFLHVQKHDRIDFLGVPKEAILFYRSPLESIVSWWIRTVQVHMKANVYMVA